MLIINIEILTRKIVEYHKKTCNAGFFYTLYYFHIYFRQQLDYVHLKDIINFTKNPFDFILPIVLCFIETLFINYIYEIYFDQPFFGIVFPFNSPGPTKHHCHWCHIR